MIGGPFAQMALVLHPELGQRAAADHGDRVEHARVHQAAGRGKRVDGAAAERLDVGAGGADAARAGSATALARLPPPRW